MIATAATTAIAATTLANGCNVTMAVVVNYWLNKLKIYSITAQRCCLNGAVRALPSCLKIPLLIPNECSCDRFDMDASNQSSNGEKFRLLYKFSGSKKVLKRLSIAWAFWISCERQRKIKFEKIKNFDRSFIALFGRFYNEDTLFKPFKRFS